MAKILIVDDEVGVRDLLGEILRSQRHDVIEASIHAEAESLLRSFSPDIVLLDYWLPEGNSYDALKRWHNLVCPMPAVIMMAHTFEHPEEDLRAIGVEGFLEKPVSHYHLMETLKPLLDKCSVTARLVARRKAETPIESPRRIIDVNSAEFEPCVAVRDIIRNKQIQNLIDSDAATIATLMGAFPALFDKDFREGRIEFERLYFLRLLAETGGSITEAAKKAGLDRTSLHRRLKLMGLEHHMITLRYEEGKRRRRIARMGGSGTDRTDKTAESA